MLLTELSEEILNLIKVNDIHSMTDLLISNKSDLNDQLINHFINNTENAKIKNILSRFLSCSPEINKEQAITSHFSKDSEKNKHLKLLYNCFCKQINYVNYELAATLVSQIYFHLTEYRKNTKEEIFSRYSNLNNKQNKLAENIYYGKISPKEFALMTSEDMKSDNLKKLEANLLEKCILDSSIPKQTSETDIFKCPKCGLRKAVYYELQTRSADEPMTTFVKCHCGHVWKF